MNTPTKSREMVCDVLTVSLTLSRISVHLVKHARYLRLTCCLLISPMVRLQSAAVYGRTGSWGGADIDRRFAGRSLRGAGIAEGMMIEFRARALGDGGKMTLVRLPAAAGLSTRGIKPGISSCVAVVDPGPALWWR